MKKLFMLAAFAAAACIGAEYRIEAWGMTIPEGSQWNRHYSGTLNGMADSSTKGSKLTGTYQIPAAGKYYIWVRTETRNEGWRQVQLSINGKKIGKFGDKKVAGYTKPTLRWDKAMPILKIPDDGTEVKVEITALQDIGRIDCVIFTTDPDFKPSNDDAEIVDGSEELELVE